MTHRPKRALKQLLLLALLAQSLATETSENILHLGHSKKSEDTGTPSPVSVRESEAELENVYRASHPQGSASHSRQLRQRENVPENIEDFSCSLDATEIEAIYDRRTRVWTLNESLLEQDIGIIQATINCSSDNDVILLNTSTTLQPSTTIVIPWNLTLSADPGSSLVQEGVIVEASSKVRLTCPREGDLLSLRGRNMTVANIVFAECSNAGNTVSLNITCENGDEISELQLHHVEFQDNVFSGDERMIANTDPRCTRLTLQNVGVVRNLCSRVGCVSLASMNILTNVTLETNSVATEATVSHAVFNSPTRLEITATNISGFNNQIRIFSLFDSTLDISDSLFLGNRVRNSSSSYDQSIGGSVLLSFLSRVTMTNCRFEDNSGQNGGVLFVSDSQLNLQICTFRRNDALGASGGAIRAWDSSVVLVRTIFFRNTARFGGACYFLRTSVTLRNVTFRSNTVADGIGGAVCVGYGEITGEAVTFFNNSARSQRGGYGARYPPPISSLDVQFQNSSGNYGGAIGAYNTRLELRPSCLFIRNQETDYGGSIALSNSTSSITSCYFRSNVGHFGGALHVVGRSDVVVQECSFQNGTATLSGGAIYVHQNSSINISNSIFSGNDARSEGGALFSTEISNSTITGCTFQNNSAASTGGAISAERSSIMYLYNTTIYQNKAGNGGGIHLQQSIFTLSESNFTQNSAISIGGAIYGVTSSLEMRGSELLRNTAPNAGGIYLALMNDVDIDSVLFEHNSAQRLGGAIELFLGRANTTLSSCNFSSNQAPNGASVYLRNTTTYVTDSLFERNNATDAGAGLYLFGSNLTMRHCVLLSNTARSHAGISMQSGSTFIGQGVEVLSNIAFGLGGGIGIDGGSSFRCGECEFKNNSAIRGAGMFANSDDSVLIVAQLQDSRFEGNNASSFGGGIYFSLTVDIRARCMFANRCSKVVLLNTSFIGNYATHSGSAIMTIHPEGVLFSCNHSNPEDNVIGRDQLRSLSVIRPNSTCTSWETIQYPDGIMSGVVATSGVRMNLSTNADKPQITADTESNHLVLNVKRTAQLPVIHVHVLDVYGNGPVPTISSSFDAVISFSRNFFSRDISKTVAGGIGEFSNISSVRPPGNYTLHIQPTEASFAPMTLIVRIHECEVGEELTSGGEVCDECGALSYNFNPSNGSCSSCPDDANCTGSFIIPNDGYWHRGPCHARVMKCLNEEACQSKGRQPNITDFTQNFTECNRIRPVLESYEKILCQEGYEGPLCASCQENYGQSREFYCSKCPHDVWSSLNILFVALYLLIVASFTIRGGLPTSPSITTALSEPTFQQSIVRISTQSGATNIEMVEMMVDEHIPSEAVNSSSQRSTSSEDAIQDVRDLEMTRWMTTEILKILINFLQVTAIAATINVAWTEDVETMFEAAEIAGALTTGALSRPIDCILGASSSTVRSIWKTLVNVFVPGTVMGVFASIWGYKATHGGEGMSFFLKRTLLSVTAVTYISYVGLTKLAVRVFYCIDVYDSDDFASDSTTARWALDTSITCYGKDHSGLIAIGVVVLFIVSLSFPLVSAFLIVKYKPQIDQQQGWMYETMGFLYRAFKENFMFWESVTMVRKACLSIIVVFSYPLGSHAQGLLAQIVIILSLCAHLECSPYRNEFHQLNTYEFGSLLVSCFTFLLGQFFGDEKSGKFTRDFVAFLIISMNILFFLFLVSVLMLSGLSHIRVVLKSEGFPVGDNTPTWKVIKICVVSRIRRLFGLAD